MSLKLLHLLDSIFYSFLMELPVMTGGCCHLASQLGVTGGQQRNGCGVRISGMVDFASTRRLHGRRGSNKASSISMSASGHSQKKK